MGTWEADDPAYSRPIAAPLEKCAELLGVDLATVRQAAGEVEPYIRVDGTKVWSLMQLERRLRPEAYGRVRGGYVTRRRLPARNDRAAEPVSSGNADQSSVDRPRVRSSHPG